MFGGQVALTGTIENYPGFASIPGAELAERMHEGAVRFGAVERMAEVHKVRRTDADRFALETSAGEIRAGTVIVATGCRHRTLDVPGEREFQSRGVSYCAVCDGPFYEGADVVVVGGGDSALQEAVFLTQYASSVTLVHRRHEFRASTAVQEMARRTPKLQFALGRVVEEIRGGDGVEEVVLREVSSGNKETMSAEGIFIYVGILPSTDFLRGLAPLSDDGFVPTDERMRTAVPGLFAAGDVRVKAVRQIATAVGEGVEAALAAAEFLREK
jgi:thioredoxin reductase (NADPH)